MKKWRRSILLLVALLALGSSLMKPEAYAQNNDSQGSVQPVQGLAIFDATSRRIGNVIAVSTPTVGGEPLPIIALRVDTSLFTLAVSTATSDAGPQFFGASHVLGTDSLQGVYFESANCSGTPFAPVDLLDLRSPTLVPQNLVSHNRLYLLDGTERTILARSVLGDDPSNSCAELDPAQELTATPIRFLIDLGARFQPPFTLR